MVPGGDSSPVEHEQQKKIFSRILSPDFFSSFLWGKSAQKNPPGKSPAKSSKTYTTKIPDNFLQRVRAKKSGPRKSHEKVTSKNVTSNKKSSDRKKFNMKRGERPPPPRVSALLRKRPVLPRANSSLPRTENGLATDIFVQNAQGGVL